MLYYILFRFVDKLVVYIIKNFLILFRVRVFLILGIYGWKGEGKIF